MQGLVRTSLRIINNSEPAFLTPTLSAVAIVTLPNGAKPAGCIAFFNSFRYEVNDAPI